MSEKKIDFNKSQNLAITADGSYVEMSRDAGIPDKATIITTEPSWFGDDKITVAATAEMTADQAKTVWQLVGEAATAFCESSGAKDVEATIAEHKLSIGDSIVMSFPKGHITDKSAEDVAKKAMAWIEAHAAKPADKPDDKPADKPDDKSDDKPTKGGGGDKPADKSGDKPDDKPADKPAKKSPTSSFLAAVEGKERGSDAYNAAMDDWAVNFLNS